MVRSADPTLLRGASTSRLFRISPLDSDDLVHPNQHKSIRTRIRIEEFSLHLHKIPGTFNQQLVSTCHRDLKWNKRNPLL